MGVEALLHRNDGSKIKVPVSDDDWSLWVSAGRTRNWVMKDPLVDWLDLYGKSRGYVPRQELHDYVKELDFIAFIFEKGRQFESGILRLMQEQHEVTTIAHNREDIRNLEKAMETFEAMRLGAPIIYQAVLWDAHNMVYGSPDFLVRSDILQQLFLECISGQEAAVSAPDLGSNTWHYRVLDTKFTTLRLNAAGTQLSNEGSSPAYKAQLFIYNRTLGRLQGFEPPESYLLGRGWQLESRGVTQRGTNAMERLGPIPQNGTITNLVPIAEAVEMAVDWVRRVRTEGKNWHLLPEPSVPELYPNVGGSDDEMMLARVSSELEPGDGDDELVGHWEGVKAWLGDELKELTQLWQVGVNKRLDAHSSGFYRWDDPNLTPADVGITGTKQGPILQQLLAVNRGDGPPILPSRIGVTRGEWHAVSEVEFYVDFEYCSDLNDDFCELPEKGGQPLIFMIGCGHVENGAWHFSSFVVHNLCETEEIRIIREWAEHMSSVRDRIDPTSSKPRIFHWSHAEPTVLQNAYNSAWNRHGRPADWPESAWYDFLQKVMRQEPVAVRGALGFGLKAVANSMYSEGLIETHWADSPVDGLGAMVGAWRSDEKARRLGVPMTKIPLMAEIARYNEVDCKAMMEIVRYLRTNH